MYKRAPLYPNLEKELIANGITRAEIAAEIGIKTTAFYYRTIGVKEFGINEARIICAYIEKKSGRAMTTKYLFNFS